MAEKKTAKDTKTTAKSTAKSKAKSAPAAVAAGEPCRIDKCKQPMRAKGYCRKHYMGWRRGKVGTKHQYNICSKEACRAKAVVAGRCAEHKKGKKAAAAAEAAPAA